MITTLETVGEHFHCRTESVKDWISKVYALIVIALVILLWEFKNKNTVCTSKYFYCNSARKLHCYWKRTRPTCLELLSELTFRDQNIPVYIGIVGERGDTWISWEHLNKLLLLRTCTGCSWDHFTKTDMPIIRAPSVATNRRIDKGLGICFSTEIP